ncbi:MAG: rubredoxin [Stellaceae bacterium]
MYKRYLCLGCGFLYDEALGLPALGIPAGTRWEDIPADWVCPDCGTSKSLFEMVEIAY